MSRIGKQPISIPEGVNVSLQDKTIKVKGPKGELTQLIHPDVTAEIRDGIISLLVKQEDEKKERSLWGLFGSLIANMIEGVTKGFEKKLEINGVGFRASVKGSALEMELGFSHPVMFSIPKDIEVKVEKNIISVSGADKQLVGEVAASIRAKKPPEPYKGKGIKYVDEHIIRKAGKQAKTTTA